MRPFLRKAAVLMASAALIFFCSCERHNPEELYHGGHSAAGAADHSHRASDPHGHATEGNKHGSAHPAASPLGTPAQFFPSATPR